MPRIQRPWTRCYVGVLADRAGGCIADGSADLAGVKVWARAQDSRPGIESGTQRGTLPNADILLQHHIGQRWGALLPFFTSLGLNEFLS